MKKEKQKKQEKMKDILIEKILKITTKIMSCIFIILVVYNILFVFYSTFFKINYLNLFGTIFYTTNCDSLVNEIGKDCFLIIKKTDDLKIDDIIAIEKKQELGITRIKQINTENGKKDVLTKKDKTLYYDNIKIENDKVIGTLVYKNSFLGKILVVFEHKITSVIIIFILFTLYKYNRNKQKRRENRNRIKYSYYI